MTTGIRCRAGGCGRDLVLAFAPFRTILQTTNPVSDTTTYDEAGREKVFWLTQEEALASLMVAAGVPIFDVAKILGHSTIAVTMR